MGESWANVLGDVSVARTIWEGWRKGRGRSKTDCLLGQVEDDARLFYENNPTSCARSCLSRRMLDTLLGPGRLFWEN